MTFSSHGEGKGRQKGEIRSAGKTTNKQRGRGFKAAFLCWIVTHFWASKMFRLGSCFKHLCKGQEFLYTPLLFEKDYTNRRNPHTFTVKTPKYAVTSFFFFHPPVLINDFLHCKKATFGVQNKKQIQVANC